MQTTAGKIVLDKVGDTRIYIETLLPSQTKSGLTSLAGLNRHHASIRIGQRDVLSPEITSSACAVPTVQRCTTIPDLTILSN